MSFDWQTAPALWELVAMFVGGMCLGAFLHMFATGRDAFAPVEERGQDASN